MSPRVDAHEEIPQIPPVAHRMVRVSVDGHELTFVCIQDAVCHLARLWSQEIAELRASEVST